VKYGMQQGMEIIIGIISKFPCLGVYFEVSG